MAKRGKRDAPRMGKWLKKRGDKPDLVLCSPAERAKQTALLVCRELDLKKKKIVWDERIYGASLEDLLAVLEGAPHKAQQVLLVGHNPGLELLCGFLVGEQALAKACQAEDEESAPYGVGLVKTGAAFILHMPDEWSGLSQGCAKLLDQQAPRELKEKKK
ncbi:putative phosphohistidine phosphatase, SixA [Magnetofaba australis IT-1]|uniref:Putative phosphohistidine phosphatase, SixA n=1 Tax=Magnetofaba australis IT-1 TaxID=1434232 RepID=A0A1Y2K5F9_9PROT|nr:putative phosphohistidine phosphatase, SixA [Magnetofaba australis IT-1]